MAQLRKDPAFSPMEADDFPAEPGVTGTYISTLLPTFDGRVLVGVERDNNTRAFFMLTASGAIDGSFSPIILEESGSGRGDVFPLGDGSLLVADNPADSDLFVQRYFADGTVDAGFAPYLYRTANEGVGSYLERAVQRSDGKIMLCGEFRNSTQDRWEGGYSDYPQFVLLDLDGQESAGFTAPTVGPFWSIVDAFAAAPDGRVAFSGSLHIQVQGDDDPQTFSGIAGEVSAVGELEQPHFENIAPFSPVFTDPSLPGLLLGVQDSPEAVYLKAPGEPYVVNTGWSGGLVWLTVVRTGAGAAVLGIGDLTFEAVIPAQHIVAGEFVGPFEFLSVGDDWDESPLYPTAGASPAAGVLFVTDGDVVHRLLLTDDDGPSPEDGCFWTDLVNVTQECGDGPPPVVDAIAVWPWYSDAWDDVFWNPDVTPVELPELTERQTRTFALGDLLDGYGDVTDYCNNVVSGVKFDGSRMYTDPLEQGRNGCTGYFYGVSVALTPKADALYTMHAQDGGAFYPELFGHPYRATAKAHVNMTGEFRLLGVTSSVNVYAGLVQVVYGGFGTGALVFTGTPTGAWTPIEDSGTWRDLFNEGEIFQFKVSFGANSMTSYPEATFALDMEFEVVAERQARVAAKVVNLQQWDEDPDMEGFGLPEEPGAPVPGVIYIIEDVEPEPSVYVKLTPSGTGFSGLVVGDLVTVDPYTGEELENHGKIKFQSPGGGGS